jgi:hypothetical protein
MVNPLQTLLHVCGDCAEELRRSEEYQSCEDLETMGSLEPVSETSFLIHDNLSCIEGIFNRSNQEMMSFEGKVEGRGRRSGPQIRHRVTGRSPGKLYEFQVLQVTEMCLLRLRVGDVAASLRVLCSLYSI